MRYKTLFRLLLKFLGVWLTIQGLAHLVFAIFHPVEEFRTGGLLSAFVLIIAGVYLFFGGRWIADKAIPGNRPYFTAGEERPGIAAAGSSDMKSGRPVAHG